MLLYNVLKENVHRVQIIDNINKLTCSTSGAGLCVLSLLASVVLALLDRRASKILKKEASGTGQILHIFNIDVLNVSLVHSKMWWSEIVEIYSS